MDLLNGLNPQQRDAVTHVDGPLLILAGAGSGKTRVITHRIAYLIREKGVYPSSILAVTFTNKAASEMRDRVTRLLENVPLHSRPELSTFHSFCVRLLRRDGDPLAQIRPGFTRRFSIYDDDDQLAIVKASYKHLGLDESFMKFRAALSAISAAKNRKETPQDLYSRANDPNSTRLAVIFDEYEKGLRTANALDFDDLLLEAVRLLHHDQATRDAYNNRIRYLMIDEYQDTNHSQYELMRLLSGRHGNVCVVGDEDQSIYSWRGADIRNILDFEKDFPRARTIRLEQNYRSTKNILEAAGAVVANNTERKGKTLWTDSGAGELIGIYAGFDAENEALFIADTIEQLLSRGSDERVAVLYRTNSQSRQIEEALRRYGRKYKVIGGFSFYQRSEVRDLVAYLKLAVSPEDSIALLRIINTPARGIGKTTVEQIDQYAREHGITLWAAISKLLEERQLATRAHAALAVFRQILEEIGRAVAKQPLNQALAFILQRTGYRQMLEQENNEEARGRLENLEEMLNAAAEGAERGDSVQEFLDHAALVSDADSVDETAQISLLTLHNAKGLEFPYVFLAGMEEGLFPHSRSFDSQPMLEEERRLCYVGMTRAEKRLYLTWARYRRRFGGGEQEKSIKSRFFAEVPPHLIRHLGSGNTQGDLVSSSGVDLTAESWEVRQTARRNTYTGKTYNSLDHIAQYFEERGKSIPGGLQGKSPAPARGTGASPGWGAGRPAAPPPSREVGQPPARPPVAPQGTSFGTKPAAKPAAKKGPSNIVNHPKYGRGTIVRREGEGDDAKLTVSFPGYGLKKIIAKFAGLKD